MADKETHTVDTLKNILDSLHDHGYGNMPILLGNNVPLLKDSISINYARNKFLIRNCYYDKKLTDAATKLKASIENDIKNYLNDCYGAGSNIKED